MGGFTGSHLSVFTLSLCEPRSKSATGKVCLFAVHHKRIVEWVLPDSTMATTCEDVQAASWFLFLQKQNEASYHDCRAGHTQWTRRELDYLQESASAARPPLSPTIKERRPLGGFRFETVERQRKIWLLEGEYCADTIYSSRQGR